MEFTVDQEGVEYNWTFKRRADNDEPWLCISHDRPSGEHLCQFFQVPAEVMNRFIYRKPEVPRGT